MAEQILKAATEIGVWCFDDGGGVLQVSSPTRLGLSLAQGRRNEGQSFVHGKVPRVATVALKWWLCMFSLPITFYGKIREGSSSTFGSPVEPSCSKLTFQGQSALSHYQSGFEQGPWVSWTY